MSNTRASSQPTRVLFLQASGLGNSILLSPALQRLQATKPGWVIDLYVYQELFGAPYEGSDTINHLIVQDGYFPPPELRTTSYDISVCAFPSNRWQYHALNRFVGANRRIAHDYPVGYWRTLRFLETDLVPSQTGIHDVKQNMLLLKPMNVPADDPPDPQFHLSSTDDQQAQRFLYEKQLEDNHLIGIHPGSGPLTWKRAPLSRFIELIDQRSSEDSHILIFGGPEERERKEQSRKRIKQSLELRSTFINKSLNETAAIIGHCDLFISNDTGLSHVAAALKVPNQITIFNGTDPTRTRPWRTDAELIQLRENQMAYPFNATST